MIDPYPKTLTYLEPVTVKDTSSPSTKVISNFCCSIYQWFTISICHTSRLAKSTLPWKGSKCKGQIPSCQPWREHSNACHPLHPRPKQPVFKYHINTCSKNQCTTCHADDRGCKRDDLLTMEIRKGAVTTWLYVLSGTTWRPANEYIHLLTMTWKHTMVDFHTPESLHAHAGKVVGEIAVARFKRKNISFVGLVQSTAVKRCYPRAVNADGPAHVSCHKVSNYTLDLYRVSHFPLTWNVSTTIYKSTNASFFLTFLLLLFHTQHCILHQYTIFGSFTMAMQ